MDNALSGGETALAPRWLSLIGRISAALRNWDKDSGEQCGIPARLVNREDEAVAHEV